MVTDIQNLKIRKIYLLNHREMFLLHQNIKVIIIFLIFNYFIIFEAQVKSVRTENVIFYKI